MTAQQPNTPDVVSALDDVLTELAAKLEPADLAALATAAKQDAQTTVLGNLLTELGQKLEVGDLSSLATAANQASANSKLDALATELGQKLEPADLAALATAAKQDAAKLVLDAISSTLSSLHGDLDTVEAKLQAIIDGPLLVETGPVDYEVITQDDFERPTQTVENGETVNWTWSADAAGPLIRRQVV